MACLMISRVKDKDHVDTVAKMGGSISWAERVPEEMKMTRRDMLNPRQRSGRRWRIKSTHQVTEFSGT